VHAVIHCECPRLVLKAIDTHRQAAKSRSACAHPEQTGLQLATRRSPRDLGSSLANRRGTRSYASACPRQDGVRYAYAMKPFWPRANATLGSRVAQARASIRAPIRTTVGRVALHRAKVPRHVRTVHASARAAARRVLVTQRAAAALVTRATRRWGACHPSSGTCVGFRAPASLALAKTAPPV
jgi:hypothetical protein